MQWLKHDTNANQDAKLKRVRMRYGMEGYGLYWYCLELIAAGVDQNKLTFELEHDAEIIGYDTGMHPSKVSEMMAYMVDVGLFECANNTITCLKLLKRLDQSMTSNKKMRELIVKAKENHDAVMIRHDSVMMKSDFVMQEETRREEIKDILSSSDDRQSKIIDEYNRIVDELKPNWQRCTAVTQKRKAAIKSALKVVDQRAKDLGDTPTEYLVRLLEAMATDLEFFSGHPNQRNQVGFNCSFDTNFRQERIAQAIDKFSGEK
jgi:hypothetical protein